MSESERQDQEEHEEAEPQQHEQRDGEDDSELEDDPAYNPDDDMLKDIKGG